MEKNPPGSFFSHPIPLMMKLMVRTYEYYLVLSVCLSVCGGGGVHLFPFVPSFLLPSTHTRYVFQI